MSPSPWVRLAPADGDQDAVAGVGIDQVAPAQYADLAPAHPGHKQQPGDHAIETSPRGGYLVGFDPAGAPAGLGCPASFARKRAAATVIAALEAAPPRSLAVGCEPGPQRCPDSGSALTIAWPAVRSLPWTASRTASRFWFCELFCDRL